MACKTMLRQILSKYGFMSVEYMTAAAYDADKEVEAEVSANANGAPMIIDDAPAGALPAEVVDAAEVVDQGTGEILSDAQADATEAESDPDAEPGF